MVRAISEAIGAFLGLAPMSDYAARFRVRQIAFTLVTIAFFVGAYLTLHR